MPADVLGGAIVTGTGRDRLRARSSGRLAARWSATRLLGGAAPTAFAQNSTRSADQCPLPPEADVTQLAKTSKSAICVALAPQQFRRPGRNLCRDGPTVGRVGLERQPGKLSTTIRPEASREMIRVADQPQKSIPPPPRSMVGISFFFGSSATMASVVMSRPATEAAFCSAARTTLVGSMMPFLTMSTYSPLCAS